MIDSDALCAHTKALLSGVIPDGVLQRFIGFYGNLEDETYLTYSSEISHLMSLALQGRYLDIRPSPEFKQLTFRRTDEFVMYDGHVRHLDYIPNDDVLKAIIREDPLRNTRIFAGMQKMKTAVMPRQSRYPSRSQFKDHMDSISKTFDGDISIFSELREPIYELVLNLVKPKLGYFQYKAIHEDYLPLTAFPVRDKSFTLISTDGSAMSSPRNQLATYDIRGILRIPEIQDLVKKDIDTFVSRAFVGHRVRNSWFSLPEPFEGMSVPINRIQFIPQAGDKERVVAVPTPLMQSLSYPIGTQARRINDSWEVQGVKSHEETQTFLSDLMANYKELTFCSIDMSNFTDRLPYDGLTSVVVEALIDQRILQPIDADILDVICHGGCLFNDRGRSIVKPYGVGTPMGTFPSFPLASMTNGLIAAYSYAKAYNISFEQVRMDAVPARVIGDDIVIWDVKTSRIYKETMDRLGVKVQPSKCMESSRVAEMCSKIITSKGVFPQKKIDTLSEFSQSNPSCDYDSFVSQFVSQYQYYGEQLLDQLSERQEFEHLVGILKDIPSPQGLGPSIDDESWDLHPLAPIWRAQKMISSLPNSTGMNARDFYLLCRRSSLLPDDLRYDIADNGDQGSIRDLILARSLARDEIISYHRLMRAAKDSSLDDMLAEADRIQQLDAVRLSLTGKRSSYDLDTSIDYHLDSSTIRDRRRHYREFSDLDISNTYQSLIDRSEDEFQL